jgi:hypothetical protein
MRLVCMIPGDPVSRVRPATSVFTVYRVRTRLTVEIWAWMSRYPVPTARRVMTTFAAK